MTGKICISSTVALPLRIRLLTEGIFTLLQQIRPLQYGSHSLNCLLKKLGCMKKALQATKQTNVLLCALINLVIPTIIWVRGSRLLRHLQTAITMNLLQMPLNIDGLLGHHTAAILLVFLQFLQPLYVDSVSLV